jgi:hypothetical protein
LSSGVFCLDRVRRVGLDAHIRNREQAWLALLRNAWRYQPEKKEGGGKASLGSINQCHEVLLPLVNR